MQDQIDHYNLVEVAILLTDQQIRDLKRLTDVYTRIRRAKDPQYEAMTVKECLTNMISDFLTEAL